jgi:hypothetical protein
MRRALGLTGILALSFFSAGDAAAVRVSPQDFPDLGNVHQGCNVSVDQFCIAYASGGGDNNTATLQDFLRLLTAGLEGSVGLIAHRPTQGASPVDWYSPDDSSLWRADVSVYSQKFGPRFITIGASDGNRPVGEASNSYPQLVGPVFRLDPFTVPGFSMPEVAPGKNYAAVVQFSSDYPAYIQILFHTGPSYIAASYPYYTIILTPPPLGLVDISSTHTDTLLRAVIATNAALRRYMSNDLEGMHLMLLSQSLAQWYSPPTASGLPGVTSPPQGSSPGAPSAGGGLGIESFPAWLKPNKVPHVESSKP